MPTRQNREPVAVRAARTVGRGVRAVNNGRIRAGKIMNNYREGFSKIRNNLRGGRGASNAGQV